MWIWYQNWKPDNNVNKFSKCLMALENIISNLISRNRGLFYNVKGKRNMSNSVIYYLWKEYVTSVITWVINIVIQIGKHIFLLRISFFARYTKENMWTVKAYSVQIQKQYNPYSSSYQHLIWSQHICSIIRFHAWHSTYEFRSTNFRKVSQPIN